MQARTSILKSEKPKVYTSKPHFGIRVEKPQVPRHAREGELRCQLLYGPSTDGFEGKLVGAAVHVYNSRPRLNAVPYSLFPHHPTYAGNPRGHLRFWCRAGP